jgi:predicted site-specific integrase-resolvase
MKAVIYARYSSDNQREESEQDGVHHVERSVSCCQFDRAAFCLFSF